MTTLKREWQCSFPKCGTRSGAHRQTREPRYLPHPTSPAIHAVEIMTTFLGRSLRVSSSQGSRPRRSATKDFPQNPHAHCGDRASSQVDVQVAEGHQHGGDEPMIGGASHKSVRVSRSSYPFRRSLTLRHHRRCASLFIPSSPSTGRGTRATSLSTATPLKTSDRSGPPTCADSQREARLALGTTQGLGCSIEQPARKARTFASTTAPPLALKA